MNEAHVFQHQYTGVQTFIYHKHSELQARGELYNIVCEPTYWIYLGKKVATDVSTAKLKNCSTCKQDCNPDNNVCDVCFNFVKWEEKQF